MKKEWREPEIEVQQFTPNEYVAACYEGECNISGLVFTDTNGNGKYDLGKDKFKYYNTACNQKFTVTGQSSPEPKANAFIVGLNGAIPVYNFDDHHVATMNSIKKHERPNHS